MRQPQHKFKLIFILGLLTSIGPFSIDMYLPAFNHIAEDLHTSISNVMYSLSTYFIGISFGQLLYGPLLERFGRKKPIYFGLVIYLLASLGCIVSFNVDMLITMRFFQAIGGCVGMVAARAMVRDLFPPTEFAKIFSSLMLIVAVSPILAPTFGGYVTAYLGWHYVFVCLFIIVSAIFIAVYYLLPQSRTPDHSVSLRPLPIFKNYIGVFKNIQFTSYALTGAISYSVVYAYITGSPHVFMHMFSASEKTYGWIFAIIAAGLIGSSQLNSLALNKYESKKILRTAFSIQLIIGSLFVLLSYLNVLDMYSTISIIFCFIFCQGFIFPNASAYAMAPFEKNAGSASALLGFLQMVIGAFSSALMGIFQEGALLAMTIIMTSGTLIAFVIFNLGERKIDQAASAALVAEEDLEMIEGL
jgi:DHA1 family bicyclomycin/chloramphenicol resistance-like MFS transporter